MTVLFRDNELTLTGVVGLDPFEDHFTHPQVMLALATIDDDADLTVYLSSPGGFVDHGTAIYNALRARAGKCHIIVTGVAASAGSMIFMAGTRKSMAPGTILMLHEPMVSFLNADSDDLAQAVQGQASYTTSAVSIYARGTGKSDADIRSLMRATTWLDAEAAVAAGFADDVFGDASDEVPAFDYTMFAKAPSRLVAMAKAQGWDARQAPAPAPSEPTLDAKAEKARADKAEAEVQRLTHALHYEDTRATPDGRALGAGLNSPTPPRSTQRPSWGAFQKD